MKKHKILSIRTVYTITCGSCHTEFDEASGCQLESDGYEPEVGGWIECPECESELELGDPYEEGEEDEEESDEYETEED